MDWIYYNTNKCLRYFFFLFRFPDLLLFLQPAENIPEVVINKEFDFKITPFDKKDILEYSKQLGYATEEWPPTYDNFSGEDVIESLAANITFSVTRRKLLTLTHFVVAMNLHSFMGSRKVTDIVNKLGPCIDYKRARNKPSSESPSSESHQP